MKKFNLPRFKVNKDNQQFRDGAVVGPNKGRINDLSMSSLSLQASQEGIEESVSGLASMMVGSDNLDKVFIINGCIITGAVSGPGIYNMASGTILHNGEVFDVPAQNGVSFGATPYYDINEAAYDSTYSQIIVNQIGAKAEVTRTIRLNNSGVAKIDDYAKVSSIDQFLKWKTGLFEQLVIVKNYNPSLYDVSGRGKSNNVYRGWAFCNENNDTPQMRGNVPMGTGGTGDVAIANGEQKGSAKHLLIADESGLKEHEFVLPAGDNGAQSGNTFRVSNGNRTNDRTITIPGQSADVAHNNIQPSKGVCYLMKIEQYWYND